MNFPVRLAINGYGRIGRCVLRALQESGRGDFYQVALINEPSDLDSMAYLTRFDSTHGIFPGDVSAEDGHLSVNGQKIRVTHADSPEAVDWRAEGIDYLLECSGQYGSREGLMRFVEAGCPRVLVSQPANSAQDVDATIVHGVNHESLHGGETIVSAASCTTNAIVPVLDLLDRAYGIRHALLTTLHSVMNDQPLIDGYHHRDLRRTRSAMQSIVPVSTGLAQGVERLLPNLAGKVQAKAIRVPIHNVSAIDMVLNLRENEGADAINALMRDATEIVPGLLDYSDNPHASIDFNHNPHSAIVDGSQTRTNGDGFANLFIWFDNEWGFANRMLDVLDCWVGKREQGGAAARR